MAQDEEQIIISEAFHQIKDLMKKEKWADAHRACLEILRFDPENLKIIRLKGIIERKVKKINIKAIKEDLKNIRSLWKEKKYTELLQHLKELAPYQNDYYPLKRFMRKVEIEYLAQTREQTKEENAADMAKINELLKDHKYQETIRIAQKLRVLKFNESKVKQLIRKIKYEWINYELQQCKTLLDSDKYEDILLTLQRIKKIDPNSAKLAKLLVNTNKKYKRFKIMEKRDFIYQGLEKTVTLMQLKKYEKAMIASREILDIDADNKKANYLHILSKRKFAKSIDTELIAQMKKGHLKNREDFNKDNSSFIKI